MESRQQIEQRRQEIVQEMLSIGPMKRGTLNEQFLRVPQKGRRKPARRGPYFVFSRKQGGRTVSERVAPSAVERVLGEIAQHHRFVQLCREFVELSEQLGAGEPGEATLKKTPKLPSRRTRK